VFALHVGHIRAQARVRQLSLLIKRRRGATGNESRTVRKNVSTRVIVEAVLTDEPSEGEQRRGADQAGPHRRDIERLDLRSLVLRWQGDPSERVIHSDIQVVNRVGSLEPRTRVLKVRVNRIRAGYM